MIFHIQLILYLCRLFCLNQERVVFAVLVLKDGSMVVQEEMLGGGARINDGRYQRFDLEEEEAA